MIALLPLTGIFPVPFAKARLRRAGAGVCEGQSSPDRRSGKTLAPPPTQRALDAHMGHWETLVHGAFPLPGDGVCSGDGAKDGLSLPGDGGLTHLP